MTPELKEECRELLDRIWDACQEFRLSSSEETREIAEMLADIVDIGSSWLHNPPQMKQTEPRISPPKRVCPF